MLHYHKPHGTTNMSIPSHSVILLKMTPMNITVIFVKKNEIPGNGFTTVKIAVILLIPIVLLEENQITRNTYNGHLFGDLYINLTVKTISMAQLIYTICPVLTPTIIVYKKTNVVLIFICILSIKAEP